MKNIGIIVILILLAMFYVTVSSQVPQMINYQAVARDAADNLITDRNISIRMSIMNGTIPEPVYVEEHTALTNKYGLFTLAIGSGTTITGEFSEIEWNAGQFFLKVELDPSGGSNYIEAGTSPLLAVPYALHSGTTANTDDADADPANEFQTIHISGTQLTLSDGGGTVTLPTAGGGDNWGTQTVETDTTINGNGTTIEPLSIAQQGADDGQILVWNGTAWAPADNAAGTDPDPENELQTLTKEGNLITLSNGGGTVTDEVDDADADPTNELQNAEEVEFDNTTSGLSATNVQGAIDELDAALNDDDDRDPANELQTLSFDAGMLTISSGNTVDLSGGTVAINDLTDAKTDNNSMFLGSGSGSDDNGNNANTALGINTLNSNTSGASNTAVGNESLNSNTTGSENSAVGNESLYSNTSGTRNSAVGYRALFGNTTGITNTALGYESLFSTTTGGDNTAVGQQALYSNTGYYNTGHGYQALYNNTTGENNTAVGYSAGTNTATLFNTGAYGNSARATASNQVRIGNSTVSSIGGYAAWSNLSDARFKSAVKEDVKGLEFIMRLRPVTYQLDIRNLAKVLEEDYRYNDNGEKYLVKPSEFTIKSREEKSKIRYTGFVAQEVENAAREVNYNFSGVDRPKNENDFYGLRYAQFVVPLVKAVQEQQVMINELLSQLAQIQAKLDQLISLNE